MISKRFILAIGQVLQSMCIIWRPVLLVALLILPDQEKPQTFRTDEADGKANHDACKAWVVTGSIRAVGLR